MAALPSNFTWVLPGRLAGLAQPGRGGGLAAELAGLRGLGLDCLVSLTETAEDFGPACAAAGLDWEYFPIPEFDVPADERAFRDLMRRLLGRLARGQALAVHCYAGVGRTGLLLACLLGRLRRLPGQEAIRRLRRLRPALETPEQELFVRRYLQAGP